MLWDGVEERKVNLNSPGEVKEVREFLEKFGLSFDGAIDYTVALFKDERMVAVGSLAGEVLRNIAVDESLQGEGLTAGVVSNLMREGAKRGRYHYFIFTKPDKAGLFAALGFKEIARAEPYAALLETGLGSIESWLGDLAQTLSGLPPGPRAGLVVNCNPFTNGHKALIARAASENAAAVVFVVNEDLSVFPFDVRIRLVREGLKEFSNVAVLPGGKYIISAATFPGYFTKGEETVAAQTRLDAEVFASRIAPKLGITSRYVGEEPYCSVTRSYNQALMDVLPRHGVTVRIMPRIAVAGAAVSASAVREYIKQERWDDIRRLVPPTTYEFLISAEAVPIIRQVKNSHGRH